MHFFRAITSLLIFSCAIAISMSNNCHAQSDSTSYEDSTHFVYPFVLKYVGSTTEIDGNYQYIMEDIVAFINKHEDFKVHIRGHVCCGPNKKISKQRAKNVFKYLVASGISEERLSYQGYSDTMPAVWPEKTDEEAAQNRRVDFIFCR